MRVLMNNMIKSDVKCLYHWFVEVTFGRPVLTLHMPRYLFLEEYPNYVSTGTTLLTPHNLADHHDQPLA